MILHQPIVVVRVICLEVLKPIAEIRTDIYGYSLADTQCRTECAHARSVGQHDCPGGIRFEIAGLSSLNRDCKGTSAFRIGIADGHGPVISGACGPLLSVRNS